MDKNNFNAAADMKNMSNAVENVKQIFFETAKKLISNLALAIENQDHPKFYELLRVWMSDDIQSLLKQYNKPLGLKSITGQDGENIAHLIARNGSAAMLETACQYDPEIAHLKRNDGKTAMDIGKERGGDYASFVKKLSEFTKKASSKGSFLDKVGSFLKLEH